MSANIYDECIAALHEADLEDAELVTRCLLSLTQDHDEVRMALTVFMAYRQNGNNVEWYKAFFSSVLNGIRCKAVRRKVKEHRVRKAAIARHIAAVKSPEHQDDPRRAICIRVREEAAKLPDQWQDVIIRRLGGMAVPQIASDLNLEVLEVRAIMRKAMARLRNTLQGDAEALGLLNCAKPAA